MHAAFIPPRRMMPPPKPTSDRVLSLWLVPSQPAYGAVKEPMDRVAKEQGLPPFEPHVTIIGNVGGLSDEDLQRTLKTLQGTGPVPVQFDRAAVVAGRAAPEEPAPWNQAAVAVVVECEALRKLQCAAKRAFFGEAEPQVAWAAPIGMPHLSLAYVVSPADNDLAAKACAALSVPADFEATELVVAEVALENSLESVWQACLRGEWREVARVPL